VTALPQTFAQATYRKPSYFDLFSDPPPLTGKWEVIK